MNSQNNSSPRPDSSWRTPAVIWREVIERYIVHRQVPTWRGRTHAADGRELPDRWSTQKATRLRHRLEIRVAQAVDSSLLPPSAFPVDAAAFQRLLDAEGLTGRPVTKCPPWLVELRRAVILNRDRYTCGYCRRSAWDVFEEEGRTLRFELDHRRARSRLADCDDFDLANIFAACRSCNVIKGQMDEETFLRELRSLGKAVTGNLRDAT
jgi:hypothetical protein